MTNEISGTQYHHKLIFHLSCHVPRRVLGGATKVEPGTIRVGSEQLLALAGAVSCNDCHPKSIKMSLPVIYVSLPLNNSVINPPQLSLVCQHSKSNEFSSLVIPLLPPWNDPFINPTQLSSVRQQSSSSSHNTTHDLQASSIPGQTSPYPSNIMPPLSTNDGNCNIYGFMVDVSKLTPSQREQHAVMLLENYH